MEETTAPEETTRRSARVRRSPVRYNAAEAAIGVVFLLMGLLAPLLGVGTAEGRHFESFNRDGVIFKYQEDIFFSDSEWVVVTDVSFTPIETALAAEALTKLKPDVPPTKVSVESLPEVPKVTLPEHVKGVLKVLPAAAM